MKKFFTLFLTLMTSVMLWAYDFQSGDLYYNITSNVAPYTVVVTSGNTKYSGDITIPSSVTYNDITYAVTGINSYAFYDCSSLTSVTIPNSVTSIESLAFYYCSSLTSVTIPSSVTSIGHHAFTSCYSLTSVTIPNSVTSIEERTFHSCYSLTSVTIPNSVTSIGEEAFYNTGIFNDNSNWENGVLYISNCLVAAKESLSGVYTIKNGTRIIADYAFRDCSSLTSVTIPNSVTSIAKGAFSGCSSLTSVTIPKSVTSIGSNAFSECSSLTSITIPNSVTSIGSQAFMACPNIVSMVVENGNPIYDSRENCNAIIETATNTLVEGCQNTIIPKSVTKIGDYAFSRCTSLKSIFIHEDITSIYCGSFAGTSSVISIIVDENNQVYDSRNNCNAIIETTTNILVRGCENTIIPNDVIELGTYSFYGCTGLISLTIPYNVTTIRSQSFFQCTNLKTMYLGQITPIEVYPVIFQHVPSFTCHIPCGTKAAYEASAWASEVSEFVEDCDNGSYSRNVRIGYNTICLPHGAIHFTGATFYEIAHILKNKKKIFFDEVKTLEAGKPYIFYPHSNEVIVYYDNTTSAIPLSHNGLHGTFDGITAASNFLKGKYLVAGNRMVLCGDGCSLAANRAYIVLDEISDKDHPAIPGIKRVSMDYSEENATTALDNITDESIVAPMQEGVYDILGRKVDAPTVSGFYIINGKKVFIAL